MFASSSASAFAKCSSQNRSHPQSNWGQNEDIPCHVWEITEVINFTSHNRRAEDTGRRLWDKKSGNKRKRSNLKDVHQQHKSSQLSPCQAAFRMGHFLLSVQLQSPLTGTACVSTKLSPSSTQELKNEHPIPVTFTGTHNSEPFLSIQHAHV